MIGIMFLQNQENTTVPNFDKIVSGVENLQKSILEIRNNKELYKKLSKGDKSRLTLSMTFTKRINTMLTRIKEEKPANNNGVVQNFDTFTILT